MKRVRFADVTEEAGRPVFPKTHRRRTLLPGPEQDDDDLEGELTEGYRGAADVEDLLDNGIGEEQGPIKRTNPLFSAANRAARRKERAKLASVQNGTFLEDVASAEVSYAVRSQNWDNSGVPLEPFNLKHERETGYFDDDGNYIAYCEAEPDDAWLESLPRGPEVDQAGEDDSDGQGRQASNDDLEPQLSADTLRGYKEGIVDLLQPGESVFGALRRLAGLEGRKRVRDLHKDPGANSESTRPLGKGRTVPPENRAAFDRLTTLSNALLVSGDYHVHANSREVLQADLLQHASGIPFREPPNSAAPEQPAASSSAAPTPQSARDIHGWRAFAARLPAPSSAATAQGRGEAQAADATGVPAPADPEEDIFADVQPAPAAGRTVAESGEEADGVVPAEPEQAQSAAAGIEAAACATPMDETIGQHDPSPLGSMSGQQRCASSSAQSVDADTVTAVTCGRQPSPSCASQDTIMVFAEAPSAASGDSLPMEGFEYDADSGYYYNSLLGAYYDPDNRLFGDAASGHWFSLQNGEYQVVA